MQPEQDTRLAKKGDKEAFIRLIKALEVSIYRVAHAFLHNGTALFVKDEMSSNYLTHISK